MVAIVTRNGKDFARASLPICTPSELLAAVLLPLDERGGGAEPPCRAALEFLPARGREEFLQTAHCFLGFFPVLEKESLQRNVPQLQGSG